MDDIPEKALEETRAALAPTLEATAAILPLLNRPTPLRFAPELNERWQAACQRLAKAWSERNGAATDDVRPAIFALFAIALECRDVDCLRLGEALASACDRLEADHVPTRTIAALSACIECLGEPGGLEHPAFAERARHFAARLEASAAPSLSERSTVLDQLFVGEAGERIERMHEALDALPPDAYALKSEALELAQQAEHLELWGIMHLARQIGTIVAGHDDLEADAPRQQLLAVLRDLSLAIAAVNA